MKEALVSMLILFIWAPAAIGGNAPLSEETESCLECHRTLHPGIVSDWERSRMSRVTPAQALTRAELERRISVDTVPEGLADVVKVYDLTSRRLFIKSDVVTQKLVCYRI